MLALRYSETPRLYSPAPAVQRDPVGSPPPYAGTLQHVFPRRHPVTPTLRHHLNAGWNLIEVIVAVAIGASIAAAALLLYSAEVQHTNTAKALQLIAQIEGLKANLRKQIDFGEQLAPTSDAALASQLLQNIKMEGIPLSGMPQTDAVTLGFSSLSVGTLDTENADGSVAVPGSAASVTLRNGVTVNAASP